MSVIDADTDRRRPPGLHLRQPDRATRATLWVENAATGSDSIVFANIDGDAAADFQVAVADGAVVQSDCIDSDFIL